MLYFYLSRCFMHISESLSEHFLITTIPVIAVILICLVIYTMSLVRLWQTRKRLYPFHRAVSIRFVESFLFLIICLINMGLAHQMVNTKTSLSRMLFFVSCLVQSLFILVVNCMRRVSCPGRSGKYKVHVKYESSEDAGNGSEEEDDESDMFTFLNSPFESLEMNDLTNNNTFAAGKYRYQTTSLLGSMGKNIYN